MYAKVFRRLFYGSLTAQSDAQLVFICLLVHADPDGHVELPPQVMSSLTGLPIERVTAALAVLEAPDPGSESKENDGRRLERFDGNCWRVVNLLKYRAMRDEEERRKQNRESKRRQRTQSANVSQRQPPSAHTEAEADTEAYTEAEAERGSSDSSGELKRGSRSKGVRGKKPVARTPIEERHILAAVERFKLPEPIVRTIAERITLEADERGYRVLPSALLNWCAREQSNPTPRGRHNGLSAAEIFALADRMEAKERADEAV